LSNDCVGCDKGDDRRGTDCRIEKLTARKAIEQQVQNDQGRHHEQSQNHGAVDAEHRLIDQDQPEIEQLHADQPLPLPAIQFGRVPWHHRGRQRG
jgi:hypothetical protein